jgi:hypothetical protein
MRIDLCMIAKIGEINQFSLDYRGMAGYILSQTWTAIGL